MSYNLGIIQEYFQPKIGRKIRIFSLGRKNNILIKKRVYLVFHRFAVFNNRKFLLFLLKIRDSGICFACVKIITFWNCILSFLSYLFFLFTSIFIYFTPVIYCNRQARLWLLPSDLLSPKPIESPHLIYSLNVAWRRYMYFW